MNKSVIIIVLVVLAALSVLFFTQTKSEKVKAPSIQSPVSATPVIEKAEMTDYQASFAIFTNGTFRIFTAPMYHNQSEDVFIQADNPYVIHVKKSGTTWDDFFKTLPFKLTKDCLTTGTGQTFCSDDNGKLRFYLNGKEDPSALDKEINAGHRLLVTYGNENEQQIQEQLQKIPVVK
ncbi:MAG TPA: hypothetical protein VNA13_01995 [Xanthomonadales bacterium]|nr:hypothetical protein [Xanthomonadales bacterium]